MAYGRRLDAMSKTARGSPLGAPEREASPAALKPSGGSPLRSCHGHRVVHLWCDGGPECRPSKRPVRSRAPDRFEAENRSRWRDHFNARSGSCRARRNIASPGNALAADAEPLDQRTVARLVLFLQVIEERTALGDHLQEATTGMVVLRVGL